MIACSIAVSECIAAQLSGRRSLERDLEGLQRQAIAIDWTWGQYLKLIKGAPQPEKAS